ncbi:hypothetical protein AA313_de0208130 [Arthrobotrys entomopaga]|nr:hypothetical protein AA313_de0208130 [Arthrobotrys entomopaga]
MNLIGEEFLEFNRGTLKESRIYITLYAIDRPLEWGGGLTLLENGDSDGDSDEEEYEAGSEDENEISSENEYGNRNEIEDQIANTFDRSFYSEQWNKIKNTGRGALVDSF